jgi:hypothetical protein
LQAGQLASAERMQSEQLANQMALQQAQIASAEKMSALSGVSPEIGLATKKTMYKGDDGKWKWGYEPPRRDVNEDRNWMPASMQQELAEKQLANEAAKYAGFNENIKAIMGGGGLNLAGGGGIPGFNMSSGGKPFGSVSMGIDPPQFWGDKQRADLRSSLGGLKIPQLQGATGLGGDGAAQSLKGQFGAASDINTDRAGIPVQSKLNQTGQVEKAKLGLAMSGLKNSNFGNQAKTALERAKLGLKSMYAIS